MTKMTNMLIVPDTHIPFHDERAWELLLKVARGKRPGICIILGDFGDFYSVSSHQKSPKHRNLLLLDEINAVNRELDRLDAALPKDCKKYYIQGNHEERLDRYLAAKAPDLYGMIETDKLFELERRGWSYTPYRQHIQVGKVFYTHDTGKSGAAAHTQAERAFSDNAVIGHTHRMGFCVQGNTRGAPHVAAMFGWLGDIQAAEYMHLVNARRDWTLGFGTGWMQMDGVTFLQPHPIVNYTACVDGVLYRA